MQGTWEMPGLQYTPQNWTAPSALVASGEACALVSLLGGCEGGLGLPSFSQQLPAGAAQCCHCLDTLVWLWRDTGR